MKLSLLCSCVCFAIVLVAMCSPAESAFSLRGKARKIRPKDYINRKVSKTQQVIKDRHTSMMKLLKQPAELIRKRLAVKKTADEKIIFNPSDPLHAYPNRVDLFVHKIFQRIATFEINNAATVRRALNGFKTFSLLGLVVRGAVLIGTLIAPAAAASFGRRRSSTVSGEDGQPIDWEFLEDLASNVVRALEDNFLKYEA